MGESPMAGRWQQVKIRAETYSADNEAQNESSMSFEQRGEAVVGAHSLGDLKLVYRILHRNLTQHPDIMESDFLIDLQDFLHRQARADGVDTSIHGDWDNWLASGG